MQVLNIKYLDMTGSAELVEKYAIGVSIYKNTLEENYGKRALKENNYRSY